MTIQITPPDMHVESKNSRRSKMVRPILLILAVLVAAAGCYYFVGKNNSDQAAKNAAKTPRSVPVTVATANVQNVPIEIRSIGNVMPYSVVNVVPQVGGQLKTVFFTQGQFVKKGDLLFQIDPSQYQAALDQALGNIARDKAQVMSARANLVKDKATVGQLEANVKRDQASSRYAKVEMNRYASLVNQGAVSKEQSDQMTTNAATADAVIDADKKAVDNARAVLQADEAAIATAQGTLKADEGVAENARIQLGWCQIRSPIDGRTGSLNVYQGNVVAPNSTTPLVTIDQVKPIYVTFTLPEQSLDEVRRCIANNTLTVDAKIEGKKSNSVKGAVSFLENTVNTQAGTVLLRATFPNDNTRLFPGQFVDVIVTMPPDGTTVVVPASAIQTSQAGNSVYVVKPDQTVDFVTVDLKRTFGDMAAIGKGINSGDVVVTDGQLQLQPGAHVDIQKEKLKGNQSSQGQGQGQGLGAGAPGS